MALAKLQWADGHETVHDVDDPTATMVVVTAPDGSFHHFRATDDSDDDGRDIYVEEKPF